MYDMNVRDDERLIPGIRSVRKLISEGKAKKVYLAQDSDEHIIVEIEMLCEKYSLEIVYVRTGKQLGEMSGIGINAATAALI